MTKKSGSNLLELSQSVLFFIFRTEIYDSLYYKCMNAIWNNSKLFYLFICFLYSGKGRNFCRVSLILYSDKSLVRKEYFYSDMKGIITLKLSSKMFESSAFSFILQSFSLSWKQLSVSTLHSVWGCGSWAGRIRTVIAGSGSRQMLSRSLSKSPPSTLPALTLQ